jgi:hypothetical protein
MTTAQRTSQRVASYRSAKPWLANPERLVRVKGTLMFGKPKAAPSFARSLVGEWRAETSSGDVTSSITAVYAEDGSFIVRNEMDVRGAKTGPVTQAGRYRVEPVDKQKFKLHTIDENGLPLTSTLRTFLDKDTMVNEVGRITFKRVVTEDRMLDRL